MGRWDGGPVTRRMGGWALMAVAERANGGLAKLAVAVRDPMPYGGQACLRPLPACDGGGKPRTEYWIPEGNSLGSGADPEERSQGLDSKMQASSVAFSGLARRKSLDDSSVAHSGDRTLDGCSNRSG